MGQESQTYWSCMSTRDDFALALKAELRATALTKVTVSRLAERVGVNRQTFYYHFADVYDLARWVFERDVAGHIMAHASYAEWARGYEQLLQYFHDHYEQVCAVLNSLSHQQREEFFLRQFREMMEAIVTELQGDLVLDEDDRAFIIDHYAATVLGHFLRWMAGNGQEDPAVLVGRLEKILRGAVPQSLERFARNQGQ